MDLFPFQGGEAGVGRFGEEPLVDEEFEAEAGDEEIGCGRAFSEVIKGELEECRGFFTRHLGFEKIACDRAGCHEDMVVVAKVKKGIEEGRVLDCMDLFFSFPIDPLGKAEGG